MLSESNMLKKTVKPVTLNNVDTDHDHDLRPVTSDENMYVQVPVLNSCDAVYSSQGRKQFVRYFLVKHSNIFQDHHLNLPPLLLHCPSLSLHPPGETRWPCMRMCGWSQSRVLLSHPDSRPANQKPALYHVTQSQPIRARRLVDWRRYSTTGNNLKRVLWVMLVEAVLQVPDKVIINSFSCFLFADKNVELNF